MHCCSVKIERTDTVSVTFVPFEVKLPHDIQQSCFTSGIHQEFLKVFKLGRSLYSTTRFNAIKLSGNSLSGVPN